MDTLQADARLGAALLGSARAAIASALGAAPVAFVRPAHPALDEHGASFVTLERENRLRGCIGTLDAHRTLDEDVRANAVAAALRDPRFPPLRAGELASTRIEVSVLGAAQPLPVADEADALARLRPFEDGLILAWRERRATFLPQVWDALPRPRDFLRELRRKAGLSPEFWAADLRLSRYRVAKWTERAVETARAQGPR